MHDPIILGRKKIIDARPLTNVTGFDGLPFAGRLSHATYISGFGGTSTFLNFKKLKSPSATEMATATQNVAHVNRQ